MNGLDEAILVIRGVLVQEPGLSSEELDRLSALAMDIHHRVRQKMPVVGPSEVKARIRMQKQKTFEEMIEIANREIQANYKPLPNPFAIRFPSSLTEDLKTRVIDELVKNWQILSWDGKYMVYLKEKA